MSWASQYIRNVASQSGEDGIIEKVLGALPDRTGWCVEFGAWDGKHLSNTYNLIANHGYAGVLIEANEARCQQIGQTFAGRKDVHAVNAFVGFGPDDNLDKILARTPIPKDFDVLSIDIDGNDYHVWAACEVYRPRVVVIEHNPTIPTGVEFVQERDPKVMHGSSIKSLATLGKRKGYELVAITRYNGVFVDGQYLPRFGIADNSVRALRDDDSDVTHIFCGFDGLVFLTGSRRLPWHDIPYRVSAVQQLPRFLRDWPENYGPVKAQAYGVYLRLRNYGVSGLLTRGFDKLSALIRGRAD
jgi:hypothetical protein